MLIVIFSDRSRSLIAATSHHPDAIHMDGDTVQGPMQPRGTAFPNQHPSTIHQPRTYPSLSGVLERRVVAYTDRTSTRGDVMRSCRSRTTTRSPNHWSPTRAPSWPGA